MLRRFSLVLRVDQAIVRGKTRVIDLHFVPGGTQTQVLPAPHRFDLSLGLFVDFYFEFGQFLPQYKLSPPFSFSFIKRWVEKKIRRHLMRARGRKGFGWKRWSTKWLYAKPGIFNGYRVSLILEVC